MVLNIVFASSLYAQTDKVAKNYNDFFTQNWKIISKAEGDLDKDGNNDVALVIEDTDRKKIIKNESLGSDTLNINPRRILVAIKKADSYELKVDNELFIPSSGDETSPCLADPFEDGLKIEKGVLKTSLNYWYSCGTWFTNQNMYTFRFQNNAFELIGYDSFEFHRGSGEETQVSINFSTRKKLVTTGLNKFNTSKPKSKTTKIKEKPLYNLNTMVLNENFSIE